MPTARPQKSALFLIAMLVATCIAVFLIYHFAMLGGAPHATKADPKSAESSIEKSSASSEAAVDLTESQLKAIKVESVGTYLFHVEKKAVGSIAYHEKEPMLNDASGTAPGSASATKYFVASIPESDSPFIHTGQSVAATVVAYPDRVFHGTVSVVGVTVYDSGGNPALDPVTHRITVRCEVDDPRNELYPGMLANIAIQIQDPVESVAIPAEGVVRKGDGTMTAWVTRDSKHFEERIVEVGMQQDGHIQILKGLEPGEQVVTNGAIFVSNILYAPPSD